MEERELQKPKIKKEKKPPIDTEPFPSQLCFFHLKTKFDSSTGASLVRGDDGEEGLIKKQQD